MVEKKYVARRRIPEYCPFGSVMVLQVENEYEAPAQVGRIVGYEYDGNNNVVSLIDGDKERKEGERVFDRLLYDGYLEKHQTKKVLESLGGKVEVDATEYGIIYEAEDGPQRKETVAHGIPSPSTGRYVCAIDILMVTEVDGEEVEHHLVLKKTTPSTFRYTFLDFVVGIRQDIISMLYRKQNGFAMVPTDGNMDRCAAPFYDSFGAKKTVIFESTKELLSTIVSVRLIDVKPQSNGVKNRFE